MSCDHSEPLTRSSIKPAQPVSLFTPLPIPVINTLAEGAEDMCEDLTVYDNKSGLAEVDTLDKLLSLNSSDLGYEVSSIHSRAL